MSAAVFLAFVIFASPLPGQGSARRIVVLTRVFSGTPSWGTVLPWRRASRWGKPAVGCRHYVRGRLDPTKIALRKWTNRAPYRYHEWNRPLAALTRESEGWLSEHSARGDNEREREDA
jgi:hypothetical protein